MTNEERLEQIALVRRDFLSGWIRSDRTVKQLLMGLGVKPHAALTISQRWVQQRERAQHRERVARARELGIHRVA